MPVKDIFTISLSSEDLTIVSTALINMPYFKVAGLIDKINEQLRIKPKENQEAMPSGNSPAPSGDSSDNL